MSSQESLIKATLNRLKARLNKKLIETSSQIAFFIEEGPDRISKEWDLFKDEIYAEAERIEKESEEKKEVNNSHSESSEDASIKSTINQLRSKVSAISQKLEVKN